MFIGQIYIIKNKINDKVYIGQTRNGYLNRYKKHLQDSETKPSKLYVAMRKYGVENFYIELIQDKINLTELDAYEKFYINKYDSYLNGYNSTKGNSSLNTVIINEKTNFSLPIYNKIDLKQIKKNNEKILKRYYNYEKEYYTFSKTIINKSWVCFKGSATTLNNKLVCLNRKVFGTNKMKLNYIKVYDYLNNVYYLQFFNIDTKISLEFDFINIEVDIELLVLYLILNKQRKHTQIIYYSKNIQKKYSENNKIFVKIINCVERLIPLKVIMEEFNVELIFIKYLIDNLDEEYIEIAPEQLSKKSKKFNLKEINKIKRLYEIGVGVTTIAVIFNVPISNIKKHISNMRTNYETRILFDSNKLSLV